MRKTTVVCVMVCAAVAVFGLAGFAHPVTVNYTVGGWGPTQFPGPVTPPATATWGLEGYPGDTVELQTYTTGTLDLTPGTYFQKINTLLWTIDYTYAGTATDPDDWSDLAFSIAATRTMSFSGGTSASLSQTGLLEVTWFNDYLSFSAGTTTSFLVGGYRVDVTPISLARVGGSDFDGDNPWTQPERDVMAQFDVTYVGGGDVVPEPLTMLGMTLGLGSVGVYIRRRRLA